MRWLKRDVWKIGSIIAGMLFLFVLMMWLPMSATSAHEGTLAVATPTIVTVQATPTEDATVTALSKEKLAQEVNQLKNQNFWSFLTNFATPFSILVALVAASFGFWRWRVDRRDAQDKELKDRRDAQDKNLKDNAEERFKTAVAVLGNEKESTQIGGAILLRSFLNAEDEKNYERYYPQIFDLVVAYLRPSNTSLLSENPDRFPPYAPLSEPPLPLTPLRQALIVVFREVFPLARKQALSRLDATSIQLDRAYLGNADLKHVWMPYSSLRKAELHHAQLEGAYLRGSQLERASFVAAQLKEANLTISRLAGANFNGAQLEGAYLRGAQAEGVYFRQAQLKGSRLEGANLTRAHFSEADLSAAELSEANLSEADLSEADLNGAVLIKADLTGADLRDANLKDTKLNGVKGLTKEQLAACKAKGAIIDEDITTSAFHSTAASSLFPPSNDTQASSTPSTLPLSDTDGSSAVSSKPDSES